MPQDRSVATSKPLPVANRLLGGLSRSDRAAVVSRCDAVTLKFGEVLCTVGEPYEHVYFPVTGFISLVVSIGRHRPLEMGMIGNEGMLGATLILGVATAPLHGVVQGSGTALRMGSAQLRREIKERPALARMIGGYLYELMEQLAQTSACTRFHEVDARLARWLLMTHDRAHADQFHLTHQFLADMLGVQRSAVTIAAGALQRDKLIRYTRGEITVISRKGLEAAACTCYSAITDD